MMGKLLNIRTLLTVITAGFLAFSCTRSEIDPEIRDGKPTLSLVASVAGGTGNSASGRTKVADTDENIKKGNLVDASVALREMFFDSLDVFVKKSSDGDDAAWYREYHFAASDETAGMVDSSYHKLLDNWTTDYEPGTKYDIYATANNPHTHGTSAPKNLGELKALYTYTPDIHRFYKNSTTGPGSLDSYTTQPKKFLMDGSLIGWTPDMTKSSQIWKIDLRRAAAKIIVRMHFSKDGDPGTIEKRPEKKEGDKEDPEPEKDPTTGKVIYLNMKDYLSYVNRTPGLPRWKFVDFGFQTADINGGDYVLPIDEVGTETDKKPLKTYSSTFSSIKAGDTSVANVDDTFEVTTYCYPFSWESDGTKAPYLLVSIGFTKNDNASDFSLRYYRIPVCDETTTKALERNNIYIVDATIASLGSTTENLVLEDQQLRIEYHVIDWTKTDMAQEATVVKIAGIKYLTVDPTEKTLRGNGTQSFDMNWYASVSNDDGHYVRIKDGSLKVSYVNYNGETTDISGTIEKPADENNGRKDLTWTSTAPTTGSDGSNIAHGEKVSVTITPGGLIKVSSDALASRAVKTIHFMVELSGTGLSEDVTILHYPLDIIQSFTGAWSSRYSTGNTETVTRREYSFNPSADGWPDGDYQYEDDIRCTKEEYDKASGNKRISQGPNTVDQEEFQANVPEEDRAAANGEDNAVNGYYGTGPTSNQYYWHEGSYDYYTTGRWNTTYYQYESYWTNNDVYYARRYYRDVTDTVPSTGNWVDWDRDEGQTYAAANAKYTYDGSNFMAKVYYNGHIYGINVGRTGWYNYSYTYNRAGSYTNSFYSYSEQGGYEQARSSYANLTNNNMYVIQTTSASTDYVLGNARLDANYQSQDKVVSPAFMIASQLGATTPFSDGAAAARHCGTYMEVGTDGTRYTGWRLPTEEEINFIISYQENPDVSGVKMVEVLGGAYYWALDGNTVNYKNGTQGTADNAYTRCVRDLTLEDIERLNAATGNE